MARHYYLTRSGRLRRKDNTLLFEPSHDAEAENSSNDLPEAESFAESSAEILSDIGQNLGADSLGEFMLEDETNNFLETIAADTAQPNETDAPVRVREKRVIPVEDVDALWAFRELELNSRVLNFLAQKKIPVHFSIITVFIQARFIRANICTPDFCSSNKSNITVQI